MKGRKAEEATWHLLPPVIASAAQWRPGQTAQNQLQNVRSCCTRNGHEAKIPTGGATIDALSGCSKLDCRKQAIPQHNTTTPTAGAT
mmetsp:Transcript_42994/g.129076  ORF Transcript_42994/g.129076 Transcript_42994/m.129076 type:complete len:87 (+) Transcript_42994:1192-1452(+)|eukprot:349855-Chlamydomonas_euryale.AAC.9